MSTIEDVKAAARDLIAAQERARSHPRGMVVTDESEAAQEAVDRALIRLVNAAKALVRDPAPETKP